MFYGRAELKQSDHRPVVGIVDVQVIMMIMSGYDDHDDDQARSIDKRRRDNSLASICDELGPSDGTVVVTPCTGSWAVSLSTIGGNLEEVVGAVNGEQKYDCRSLHVLLFSSQVR